MYLVANGTRLCKLGTASLSLVQRLEAPIAAPGMWMRNSSFAFFCILLPLSPFIFSCSCSHNFFRFWIVLILLRSVWRLSRSVCLSSVCFHCKLVARVQSCFAHLFRKLVCLYRARPFRQIILLFCMTLISNDWPWWTFPLALLSDTTELHAEEMHQHFALLAGAFTHLTSYQLQAYQSAFLRIDHEQQAMELKTLQNSRLEEWTAQYGAWQQGAAWVNRTSWRDHKNKSW